MLRWFRIITTSVLFIGLFISSTTAAPIHQFREEFLSTALRDSAATTAAWDTVGGKLTLDAFTPLAIGSIGTSGAVVRATTHGNLALLASRAGGLEIVDISDPGSPVIVGSLELGGFINAVAAAGEYVYVTDEEFGVRKIRVSDPAAPVVAASYDTPGEPTEVTVSGDLVIVNDAFSLLVLRSK